MGLMKLKSGKNLTLCAFCESNHAPEWVEFIRKLERQNPHEADKIFQFFDLLCDSPNLIYKNPEKYAKYSDDIYCLKPSKSVRLMCFHDGRTLVIITHGVIKKTKSDKRYQREILYALKCKKRYFDEKS